MTRLLIFFLSFYTISSFAQAPSIQWSEKVHNEGGLVASFTVLGHTNEEIFVNTYRQDKEFLTVFNMELEELSSIEIEESFNGIELNILDLVSTSKGVIALFNGKEWGQQFHRYKAEYKDGSFSNFVDLQTASTPVEQVNAYGNHSDRFRGGVNSGFIQSENQEFYGKVTSFNSKESKKTIVEVAVFDAEFNRLWSQKTDILYKNFEGLNAQISNTGEVYFLYNHKNGIPKEKKQQNYMYSTASIIQFSNNDIKTFGNVFDSRLRDLQMYYNNLDDRIYCFDMKIGQPDKDYHHLNTGGYSCEIVNTTDGSVTTVENRIDGTNLKTTLSKKLPKYANGVIPFKLQEVLPTEDGFLLISEGFGDYRDGEYSYNTVYFSHELYCFKTDKAMNIQAVSVINKTQSSGYSPLRSYGLGQYSNNYYLIYNNVEMPKLGGMSQAQMAKINTAGIVESVSYVTDKVFPQGNGLTPTFTFQIDNRLYLFANLIKNYRLGYLDLD